MCGVILAAAIYGVMRNKVNQLETVADRLELQLQSAQRLKAELDDVEKELMRVDKDSQVLWQLLPGTDVALILAELSEAARGEIVFERMTLRRERLQDETTADRARLFYNLEIEFNAPSTAETTDVISRLQRFPWCKSAELVFSNVVHQGEDIAVERAKVKAVIQSEQGEGRLST